VTSNARDEGSTLPLTIFFGVLCLVLILIVVDATSLYLERKRLFTVADGAALAGSEAFATDEVALTPNGFRPTLRSQDVAAAATAYLAGIPQPGFDALALTRADTDDGLSATVTLSADWHPPVLTAFVPDGVRIEVTAVARSVFG
jgi:uncharacterized membrane protein